VTERATTRQSYRYFDYNNLLDLFGVFLLV